MSGARHWVCLAAALLLTGCLGRHEIGRVASDAGAIDGAPQDAVQPQPEPTALEVLRAEIVGDWCGTSWRGTKTDDLELLCQTPGRCADVQLDFGADGSYRFACATGACGVAAADLSASGGLGEYVVTDVTFDGQGWGFADQYVDDEDSSVEGTLDNIVLNGRAGTLGLVWRAPWRDFLGAVHLSLKRCE